MYVRMCSMFTHTMFICVYAFVCAYVNRKRGHPSKNDQSYNRASMLDHIMDHICDFKMEALFRLLMLGSFKFKIRDARHF